MKIIFNYCLIFVLLPNLLSADTRTTITLGLPVCLTGPCAEDGQDTVDAVKLAIEEINNSADYDFKLNIRAEDTAEAISAAKAITAYRKLRSENISFFIGPSWTPGGLALAPILSKDQVVIISPSLGDARFHQAGNNIFNFRGTDESNSRKIADIAYQNGCRQAAILASHQPWELAQGEFFEDQFKKIGGNISTKIQVQPDSISFKNEALKIKLAKPDCLFMANYISLGLAAKDLKQTGFDKQIYSVLIDDQRLAEAHGTLEGAMFLDFKKGNESFYKKFTQHYKRPASRITYNAYDATYVLATGIKQTDKRSAHLVAMEIQKLDYTGTSGKILLDSSGCAIRESELFIIKNGKREKAISISN